ncbi:hypothetical protein I3842_05G057100 [Carya illinoinensis]|uniref:Cupin type-1 domain-containing protein n=1 Tax=Carya illinoinensis TaxID=32201 RepID=A0A922F113_CARIL|nr:hypothetical protein I3842_05G057100 [Carya illinoinensis]
MVNQILVHLEGIGNISINSRIGFKDYIVYSDNLRNIAVDKYDSIIFVNGKLCKNAKDVKAGDFFFQGCLNVGRDTLDLNTLGISLARIDFASYGQNPPHTHPRATKVLFVLEGTLYVAFVTSNQAEGENLLFTKVLNVGDVFIFLAGLNPEVITIVDAVFGSESPINPDVLTKAFQVDKNLVEYLHKLF